MGSGLLTGLVFDTTGEDCAVGLYDPASRRLSFEKRDVSGRGHAEHLMPMIGTVFAETGTVWAHLSEITVATGPGSFAGIRVGVAAARGIALARGIPSAGVSHFDAFFTSLRSLETDRIPAVVLDARRNEIYAATEGPGGQSAPFVTTAEAFAGMLEGRVILAGSAAPLVRDAAEKAGLDAEVARDMIAPSLADIVSASAMTDGRSERPVPFYLRPPDAKPQRSTLIARL